MKVDSGAQVNILSLSDFMGSKMEIIKSNYNRDSVYFYVCTFIFGYK